MKKKKLKQFILYLLLIISLVVFIYSIINIALWYIDVRKNDEVINDINKLIQVPDNIDPEEQIDIKEDEKTGDYWDYIKTNFIDVDLTKLKTINEDTVGWIR